MATKNLVQQVFGLAETFVTKQKGTWEHAEWEAFLADIGKQGVEITDETKRNLGNILEACKYFHFLAPTAPAKKAAAKPKARSTKK